jgi:hypothetical protein
MYHTDIYNIILSFAPDIIENLRRFSFTPVNSLTSLVLYILCLEIDSPFMHATITQLGVVSYFCVKLRYKIIHKITYIFRANF